MYNRGKKNIRWVVERGWTDKISKRDSKPVSSSEVYFQANS